MEDLLPQNKLRLCYILAASHSGSTLLALLLGAHPHGVTVGELKARPEGYPKGYHCSCGTVLSECPFWKRLAERMAAKGIQFDICRARTDAKAIESAYVRRLLGPLCRGTFLEGLRDLALNVSPAWRASFPLIQRTNLALMETLLQEKKASVVIDSSKTALRLKYLWEIPSLDVKVVWLVRDGRAVALTYHDPARFADARDPKMRAGGRGSEIPEKVLSLQAAAYQWKRSMEDAQQIIARLPDDRWIQLRYESLCADPKGVLSKVFTFLDLDPSLAVEDFRSVQAHVLGNGMRLDKTSEVVFDERWKSVYTPSMHATFERVAGSLNRRYGYL